MEKANSLLLGSVKSAFAVDPIVLDIWAFFVSPNPLTTILVPNMITFTGGWNYNITEIGISVPGAVNGFTSMTTSFCGH